VDSGVGASIGSGHRGDLGSHEDPQEERQDGMMTETDQVILAAAVAVIYLIGPAAIWRITKAVAECVAVILLFVSVS